MKVEMSEGCGVARLYVYILYIVGVCICVCTCDESVAEGLVAEGLGQQRRVETTLVVLAHLLTETRVRGTAMLAPSVVMRERGDCLR